MTRFGESLPLWHNFKSIGQFFEVYLVFGKKVAPTVVKCFTIEQVFVVVDGLIL